MTEVGDSQRLLTGAIIGALFGFVFGAIMAIGAAHGDSTIKSGMSQMLVFVLSFLGWLVSAVAITKLWKYAHDKRSAIRIGMISGYYFVGG